MGQPRRGKGSASGRREVMMVPEKTPPSSRSSLAIVGKREPVSRREGCWNSVFVVRRCNVFGGSGGGERDEDDHIGKGSSDGEDLVNEGAVVADVE
jgi:hypothetical protein